MAYVLPILFIPAFIAFWCLVVNMIALMSGWRRLATRFRTEKKPQGRSFSGQSMRMGLANYSGCLNAVVSPEGLYLSLFVLFRIGHPPLLIPWTEIYDTEEGSVLFWKYTKLSVGKPALATLKLSSTIMDEAKNTLRQQHPAAIEN